MKVYIVLDVYGNTYLLLKYYDTCYFDDVLNGFYH